MCGIIGFIGYDIALMYLINGLKQLQNRGYDSAGIMGFSINDNIIIRKYASTAKIDSLEKLTTSIKTIFLKSAIGHTRWATHGAKTDANAHPHSSMNNLFYIVHNGIIENYKFLKQLLIDNKYTFYSETDSEIISNLIEYLFRYLDKFFIIFEPIIIL